MTSHSKFAPLFVVLLVTVAVYWPGLRGPFVFDDEANFVVIQRWLSNDIGWRQTMFGVDSGPGGRPLAMLSFMLSAWLGGLTPFSFKLGNLIVHLANGSLLYALTRCLAKRDPIYSSHVHAAALVLTAIWLLHPFLASTVLYAVQRMAMLSATFVLLGLLLYCVGRNRLELGHSNRAVALLFFGIPICTLMGALAKENGLLLPLLCGVIEFGYYRPESGKARPIAVRLFVLAFMILPIIIAMILLLFNIDMLVGAYANREFTLWQRLLTESRVLWDYVAGLILPWGPRFSLFRDDYLISTGLLAPPQTLLAIIGWAGATAIAWRTRHRIPALAVGLGLFIVGHSMESSVVPLLIYFEHRNYLPAVGVLWAAGALLLAVARWLSSRMTRPRTVFGAGLVLLVGLFAWATHERAWIWADEETLLASSLASNPDSRWLRMTMAIAALQENPPDAAAAHRHYAALQAMSNPISRQIGAQGQVITDCAVTGAVTQARVDALFSLEGQPIAPDQYKPLSILGALLLQRPCAGLAPDEYARRVAVWMDASPTSEMATSKRNLRQLNAQLLLKAGDLDAALQQVSITWDAGSRELPLAAMMIGIQIASGRLENAQQLLDEVTPNIQPGDIRANEVFKVLQSKIYARTD